MSEQNEREAAQVTKQDGAVEAITIAVLVDVVGEPDWHRGFQFRKMRPATADDLRAALAKLADPGSGETNAC